MVAFIGGALAAAMSPWPDAVIPLVFAAEAAYLTMMVSHPKFRDAVDAELNASRRQTGGPTQIPAASLRQLLDTLPQPARDRFTKLRDRCLEMQRLASGVRGNDPKDVGAGEDLRQGNLDRLLWIFLRLLVSQESMRRFLRSTSDLQLSERVKDLEGQLKTAETAKDERLQASLKDSLAMAHLRLDNYEKADKNAQFVMVELDRIETKIQTMTEMMVNQQDPDLLSSQVDQAAQSMTATESAIKDLQSITGLSDQLSEPPPILSADLGGVLKREA